MKYTLTSGKELNIPDAEIKSLQDGLKVSYNEAVQCWLDDWAIDHEDKFNKLSEEDKADIQSPDLVELDKKAKGYRRENAKSDKKRVITKPKTVHVADEKKMVFATIKEALTNANLEYTIEKEDKLIYVKVNDKTIKLDFVELGKYKKGATKK
jgi:hypothetical protein